MRSTRVGISWFVVAVAAGSLYSVPGYSHVGNLVSELAAQRTPRSWIMAAAFVALGLGIALDGLRRFRAPLAPFVAFGLFMALAGLFGHRPIDPGLAYSEAAHRAHGGLATAAGISITCAFAWQAWRARTTGRRAMAAGLALLCLALPLAMLALPAWQGGIQRLMYALVFLWLWFFYPRRVES